MRSYGGNVETAHGVCLVQTGTAQGVCLLRSGTAMFHGHLHYRMVNGQMFPGAQ